MDSNSTTTTDDVESTDVLSRGVSSTYVPTTGGSSESTESDVSEQYEPGGGFMSAGEHETVGDLNDGICGCDAVYQHCGGKDWTG